MVTVFPFYRILELADKYDTPIVRDLVKAQALPQVQKDPFLAFGLGVVYRDLDITQHALEYFERQKPSCPHDCGCDDDGDEGKS